MSLSFIDPTIAASIPPPRIVGGYEVEPAFKYPAIVSLFFNIKGKNEHWCGGSLYNGNTIITAAHCVIGEDSQWTAKIHRHDLSKSDAEEGGKTYKVIKRIPHPSYNATSAANDIAIWKINAPKGGRTNVEIDDGKYGKDPDTLLTAIGWGRVYSGGPASKKLLEVKLPIYDYEQCSLDYAKYGDEIYEDKMICAGYPEGKKDTCQGDSGGPLFKYVDGKQILVGITSFGRGCAKPHLPGVYTRVSNYDTWIKQNVNSPNN
ncbi:putative trypsin-like serine protease precursor [Conidiobolus coronatus NRRL 28638]|uniref:Putative trypsin-like serine protease n=1 Tax=Conidiobolus coronatus (strain ATCC 28846 / CBS 209.66 / NRRL 28638) TaxID=796925 RepID=A0A137NW52_CONC2|nr:putative trypsin-like serine protease precursor [Conidiobolus coronatus NRRL 28638]|eukprot:KXN67065.1 putative trypsin-like serine protease precursor [Conidiobolus coronatus NRRL 28638]